MSSFYTDSPPFVLHKWLSDRIGIPWSTDFRALARVVNGEIVGVVAFEGFTGTSCRMHMAGDTGHWLTKQYIRKCFHYPFVILDLPMVFTFIPSGNTESLDINLRLGFRELLCIKDAHPDGALHVMQLLRSDWMRNKFYGQESTQSA
jgi:RimJ/RimL family protein N-acetyltransferase